MGQPSFGKILTLLAVLAGMALAGYGILGCTPIMPDFAQQAGYRAPADFSRGIGKVSYTQSVDGKTVYWECPYNNDTDGVMLCTVLPCVNVREPDTATHKGKILWTGNDRLDWKVLPGQKGYVGGKIVIPDEYLKPVLHWENGGAVSATANDR